MRRDASLTKGLKGRKVSAQSKGPGSAADHFTGFAGVVSRELPDGWQLRRLGELVERPQYGLTASATGEPKGPRFLRITDIQESRVVWETVPYCECDARMAERLRLRPGDVVVARIGATTGKAYLIRDEVDAVFASYLIRLRVTDRLAPDFLGFFTNSARYWRQIDSVKGGRLKQGINIPLLESLEIPLPPLAEQRAIAEVLRTVQRAKEATEKVIAATRQLKASLMKHLFTYGPVPFAQADQVELKETETGPVPEHWSCVPLGEVLTLAYRYPSYYNIQYVEQGVPEIRGKLLGPNGDIEANMSMLRFISRETSDRFPKTQLEPGDVVMSVRGTMGKIGLVPLWLAGANITANLIRFALQRGKVLPEFLKRTLLSRSFLRRLDELSPQTTIKTIQAPVLRGIPIPLPPLSEQREMAAQLAAVDAKLAAEERRRNALDALFKSVLHHLMTGKLRLPEFATDTSNTKFFNATAEVR